MAEAPCMRLSYDVQVTLKASLIEEQKLHHFNLRMFVSYLTKKNNVLYEIKNWHSSEIWRFKCWNA